MAINFTYYPESNRVPGIYVEMDPSQANTAQTFQRSLVLGQITDGDAEPGKPLQVESLVQIKRACGRGSILAQMGQAYRNADTFGDIWLLPFKDNNASQAATGKLVFEGPAASSGTLHLYIGGVRVQVPIFRAAEGEDVADSVAETINANLDLAVTAKVSDEDDEENEVILTARNKGALGNDIDLRINYRGQPGGEQTPDGLTVTITPMSGGTANPDIAPGLDNLSDQTFDFITTPYTDTANLDAMRYFLDDMSGRWSWEQMLYGGAFAAHRGSLGQQTAFGHLRNDQHMAVMSFNDSPDTAWEWAAQIAAHCAASLRVDPGLPLQYIGTQLKAPPVPSRWTLGERNTLLYDGLSTFRVGDDNTVIIERMRTSYLRNLAGADDDSYLDVETMYGLMFVARSLTNYLLSIYARKKLVSDETPIMAGSNCVNPHMIKTSVICHYRTLEFSGYVQNAATFARNVVVENAGRGLVKILAPVDLVNQLRQIAILLQFRKS